MAEVEPQALIDATRQHLLNRESQRDVKIIQTILKAY